MWLDLKGAVVADTVYDSGVLTAKDTCIAPVQANVSQSA